MLLITLLIRRLFDRLFACLFACLFCSVLLLRLKTFFLKLEKIINFFFFLFHFLLNLDFWSEYEISDESRLKRRNLFFVVEPGLVFAVT